MRATILGILVSKNKDFVSGEEMSKTLGISRAAVWKHIESLKKEGYSIESITRKGYRLVNGNDMMETVFYNLVPHHGIGKEHVYLEEVDSTNTYAKAVAEQMPDGTVVLSNGQTAGKGRLGRLWDSAGGKGIWMSVILKPAIQMSEAIMLTHMAGAAVCHALCDAGFEARIKWPNDIVINGRKVCGILAEMDGEPDLLRYVVMGIGVNINHQEADFPEELKDKAISLMLASSQIADRNRILRGILEQLDYYYGCIMQNNTQGILSYCKSRSATLNQEVQVIGRNGVIVGEALDLTDRGGLLIKDKTGQTMEIISGEVSVRGIYGYV